MDSADAFLAPLAVKGKIAQMRARGNGMISDGEGLLAAADELEATFDRLLRIMDQGTILTQPIPHGDIKPSNVRRGGKQPGSISSSWRERLVALYEVVGDLPFEAGKVAGFLLSRGDKLMARSQVARQFEPYVTVGYLSQPGPNLYQFTEAGLRKLQITPSKADSSLDEADGDEEVAPSSSLPVNPQRDPEGGGSA